MSLELMTRVWKLENLNSTEKFVLLAYGSYANEKGCSWPSKETVARRTSLSKATIKRTVARLCAKGRLVEMPLHVGYGADNKRRKVRAYLVQPEGLCNDESEEKLGALTGVPKHWVQSEPGSLSSQTRSTEYQEHRKNASSGVTVSPNNVKNNKSIKYINRHRGIILDNLPDSIDPEIAREVIDHREKQKKPLTQGAFNRLIKTALQAPQIAGITANEALQKIPDRGWYGLELEWLVPMQSKMSPRTSSSNRRSRDIPIADMLNDQW
ncbi:helix-turn-helix domain-containing protein [Microbulbifer variabilis]|uniref:helix-turn-helix domain-containing protein n=1 Tax=Microbulbifer variabilis TaxID=266805 RepID=UPI0003682881|nr:helix-turn-helix domain-containing protein [Microbulbifer variabilis]